MKKILFVATVTRHINAFHIPYLKWFKEQGYEVHVASNGDEEIEYCDKHFNLQFERNPLKINNIKVYKELKNILNENNYEIVHCHTPVGGALTRLAAKKARKNGTRVIYTAHGFHFYKGAPLLNWLIYYPIEKILAKCTDCLITINTEDYEIAKNKFKKCKQIELVHGVGLNTEKFNVEISEEERLQLRNTLGYNKEDILLICVAELNKNKNQLLLINTMEKLVKENQNIHLILVGKGISEEEYKTIVKEKHLEKNIQFLGYRKDIPQLLSISDIGVAASLREGLPVNIMEMMYMGLPIVCTENRGHCELVKENQNGYIIKNQNIDEFANKINKTINNAELLSKNGKSMVKKYCIEEVKKEMEKIYKENKKRIIHFLNTNSYSGAENVAITIINKMKEYKDIECFYVSKDGPIREILEKNGVNFIPIKKASIKEIRRVCKEIHPDIIHAHDFTATVVASASMVKTKVIAHIHHNADWLKKINLKSLAFLFFSFKYRKILMVSEAIGKEYIFGSVLKNKCEIIGNPIDNNKIIEKADSYSIKENYDLIYLGRLSNEKDPIRFINIVYELSKENSNIRCAIVGNGNLEKICKNIIKEKSLDNNIKMYGFIENPYPILKSSKVLCMTSKWEGFGLAAAEALMVEKPVVAPKVGGLIDIVDEKCGKLCIDDNEFINEISLLLKDNSYYMKKTIAAKEKSIKLNNIDYYMQQINELYNN